MVLFWYLIVCKNYNLKKDEPPISPRLAWEIEMLFFCFFFYNLVVTDFKNIIL